MGSVLGLPARCLPSGPDLPPVHWALPGRGQNLGMGGAFHQRGQSKERRGRVAWQGPPAMPAALSLAGRPSRQVRAGGRSHRGQKVPPTFCGPGLLARRGLHWAPARPCSHDRHRVAFTARCLPPSRAGPGLAFPTGRGGGQVGGVPRGPLDPASHFSPCEVATPVPTQEWPQEGSSCLCLAPQAGPAGLKPVGAGPVAAPLTAPGSR